MKQHQKNSETQETLKNLAEKGGEKKQNNINTVIATSNKNKASEQETGTIKVPSKVKKPTDETKRQVSILESNLKKEKGLDQGLNQGSKQENKQKR